MNFGDSTKSSGVSNYEMFYIVYLMCL
jgi:hypothetical protein